MYGKSMSPGFSEKTKLISVAKDRRLWSAIIFHVCRDRAYIRKEL